MNIKPQRRRKVVLVKVCRGRKDHNQLDFVFFQDGSYLVIGSQLNLTGDSGTVSNKQKYDVVVVVVVACKKAFRQWLERRRLVETLDFGRQKTMNVNRIQRSLGVVLV